MEKEWIKYNSNNIYHYTTINTAMEFILSNMTLRFSPFRYVNDPKERNDKNVAYNFSEGKEYAFELYRNFLNRTLLDTSKVLCFSQDIKTESQSKTSIELKYNKGYNKPRMWAQYGENHRGVCLQLNKEKLNEQLNLKIKDKKSQIYRGEVEYNNRFDEFVSALNLDIDGYSEENYRKNIKNHVIKHRKKLFLTKATDWRDEQEYRFIYMSEEDEGFES